MNEEPRISRLLLSLKTQTFNDFETLIVDGGSSDATVRIAEKFGATVIVRKGCKEFPSRNLGAQLSKGDVLLFLSADVFLSKNAFELVDEEFRTDKNLSGLCGLGTPFDAPFWMKFEYLFHWRLLRVWMWLTKDYHASTNLMGVRRGDFHSVGEFTDEIFADTIFFNKLGRNHKVKVLPKPLVFVSGRRARKMGFSEFTMHFLYVILYDYLPFLRKSSIADFLQRFSSDYRARKG